MEELIAKKLKELKTIRVSAEFKKRSLAHIFALPQTPDRRDVRLNIFESITLGAAIVLTSVLLILVFGGGFGKKATIAGEKSNIDLEIGQAEYFGEEVQKEVALRLQMLERRIQFEGGLEDGTKGELLDEVQKLQSLIE